MSVSASRRGATVGLIGVLLLSVTACGSRSDDAAVVGTQAVRKATLAHWIPIEAIISRETNPQRPPPKGEIPDPPNFTACVEYTRSQQPALGGPQGERSNAQLKSECRQRYQQVRDHMLTILITAAWLSQESAALGVRVSDADARAQFAHFRRELIGSDADFQRYLKYTGENVADELFVSKMDLESTRINEKVTRTWGRSRAATFYRGFVKRWVAKTTCTPGYVVPVCREYKGPLPPEPAS